ncbi:hypothetical protein BDQ17DRAFT_1542998 [Cyathus striatus]|nr:hypothetical protein BDQ17DRAFT_1542998 [Cyathus striatus]
MAFRNANNVNIGTLHAVDYSRGGESEWELLKKTACLGAGHRSEERYDAPKCHPETREAVIKDIMSWVDTKGTDKGIMWMHGPAGAGKSAIAQTVAELCYNQKQLAASFFFSRTATGTGRNNGIKLVPTIAYQLGISSPSVKRFIISELEEDEAVLSHSMEIQMETLVMKPLSDAIIAHKNVESDNLHIPHMVIIDGLDECNVTNIQSRIVKMIASMVAKTPLHLCFLIASRPELEIRSVFGDNLVSSVHIPLVLDSRYNPDEDIHTYLRSEFAALKRTHTLASTLSKEKSWPSESDLQYLVKKSSGQFIYVSTVVKFIKDNRKDPREGLSEIISIKQGETHHYSELDELYIHILVNAVSHAGSYNKIQLIFQALLYMDIHHVVFRYGVTQKNPHTVAGILGTMESNLHLWMADLHSIVDVSKYATNEMKFFHASFGDFLKDPIRSKCFYISEMEAHAALSHLCLNIILQNEIPTEKIERYDHVLLYAYTYFILHLSGSNFEQNVIDRLLQHRALNLQNLSKVILEQPVLQLSDFHSELCRLYEFDLSADNIFDSAVPLNTNIPKLFGHSLFDVVDDNLRTLKLSQDETLYWHISAVFGINEKRIFPQRLTGERFEYYILGEILENPTRARNHFLNDIKSEQIFRCAWSYITTDDSHDISETKSSILSESISPASFEYLLHRIKPSSEFKVFLLEFSQKFESAFFKIWKEEPDDYDFLKKSIESLMRAINEFIKASVLECDVIENIQDIFDELDTCQLSDENDEGQSGDMSMVKPAAE